MINFIKKIYSFFKYPCLLPCEVGLALGFKSLSFESFEVFLLQLISREGHGSRLKKFMPRERAESLFLSAEKREIFRNESLFSFQFSSSWLGVSLQFDDANLLRRAYLMHERVPEGQVELTLQNLSKKAPASL